MRSLCCSLLLLLALAALRAAEARADVAGRGSFTVGLGGFPAPPNVPFEGDIVFDSLNATPLGTPVDLGASIGQVTFTGSAAVSAEPPSATFSMTADDPDSTFAFTASGGGACDQPDCIGGTATFAGRFDSVAPGFLPDGVFTFDGTAGIAFPTGPGGVFGLNAFASVLTAEGSMVTVASGPSTYFDSRTQTTRAFAAQATFEAVSAAGGTSFAALSSVPGAPPAGIALSVPLSIFVDVETTAVVTGPIRVCIAYEDTNGDGIEDGSGVSLDRLRLLHATVPPFVDVTTSVADGLVCGIVSSLSPFVVGASDSGSSTTTTIASGGTTTTTLPLGGCEEPVACIELALGEPFCAGEQLNPKLQTIITAKLGKAKALLQRAGTVTAAKVAKLMAKARKQLARVGTKADAFVTKKKGPVTAGCRDGIRAALDQIGAALTANPPTGGSTPGAAGVQATIPGRPAFQGVGFFYDIFPIYAEGCERFPGSKECKRLVTFSIENSPLGAQQTLVQPEAGVPWITYSEYPIASPSVSADIALSSTAGTTIEVTGLVNGRLQGRFSGTFAETHPGGGPSVVIEGTFNVPQQEPPF